MANEEFNEDQFIITLTIEGTNMEEVEVEVTDEYKPLREQIQNIVSVFELPKMDGGGNPVEYQLGRICDDGTKEILYPENDERELMSFVDYNVQPGDHLELIKVPLAG